MATRKPYPSDVSDEEWAFVAPYLALVREDAPQRNHDLREKLDREIERLQEEDARLKAERGEGPGPEDDARLSSLDEHGLRRHVLDQRYRRSFGAGMGNQTGATSTDIVDAARRVEGEMERYDAVCQKVLGRKARHVRSLSDDAFFGIHLDEEGEIQRGALPYRDVS